MSRTKEILVALVICTMPADQMNASPTGTGEGTGGSMGVYMHCDFERHTHNIGVRENLTLEEKNTRRMEILAAMRDQLIAWESENRIQIPENQHERISPVTAPKNHSRLDTQINAKCWQRSTNWLKASEIPGNCLDHTGWLTHQLQDSKRPTIGERIRMEEKAKESRMSGKTENPQDTKLEDSIKLK